MSSTNHDRPTAGELVPVKFSRLTRRGVLLGLSLTQLITLAIGGATLIGAFYAGGGMLLAYTAPIWVLAASLTWIPIAGRPIVEWLPSPAGGCGAPPAGNCSTDTGSSSHAPSEPSPCPATWRDCANTPTPTPAPE